MNPIQGVRLSSSSRNFIIEGVWITTKGNMCNLVDLNSGELKEVKSEVLVELYKEGKLKYKGI